MKKLHGCIQVKSNIRKDDIFLKSAEFNSGVKIFTNGKKKDSNLSTNKVWTEKNATGSKLAIDEKNTIYFIWSWNLVKMISSCEGTFDKVSWL